jgi:Ca-activated chloride channel family protein
MEGNFYAARGMYTEAESAYLRSLEYRETAPYGEFGLGAGFIAQDEGDAALRRFAAAEQALTALGSEDRELLYRLRYNRGIALFGKGEYAAAAAAFRSALETDGGRIEAKRNLELCLLSVSQSVPAPAPGADSDALGGEGALIFEYLRGREKSQWENREWFEDEPPSGPDY